MRAKQVAGNQKFFRRTSASPWENPKVGELPQNHLIGADSKTGSGPTGMRQSMCQVPEQKELMRLLRATETESTTASLGAENNAAGKKAVPVRGNSQRIYRKDS